MTDCIFCKIITGDIPSTNVFRDEQVTAFRDLNPAAPTHILLVPNKHIDSVNTLTNDDEHQSVTSSPQQNKLPFGGYAEGGYRLIMNTNAHAGQTVFHIHLHLLGGTPMKHRMG
jgi:histidine triad (HIT) family protein